MKEPGRPLPPLPPLLSGVRLLAGGQRVGRSVHCKQREQRANGDTNDDDDDDDDEEDEERGQRHNDEEKKKNVGREERVKKEEGKRASEIRSGGRLTRATTAVTSIATKIVQSPRRRRGRER
ncbi:hypothetical protein WH47_07259 [Habropoda laboriosa]|uniref:Uncharacterized protein n=1 Tax=Habropoda laboriosa TaxID=597456 RepID=A0A0L7R5M9_9HYME|nr:hypothetical protein WH47_07259 [Habropoda laboriosa]